MKVVKMTIDTLESDYEERSLTELVEQLPRLMLALDGSSCFPSLKVFNDLFSKGEIDDGMSGGACWLVFSIDEKDRQNLKQWLSKKYSICFSENEFLDGLESFDDWMKNVLRFCQRS